MVACEETVQIWVENFAEEGRNIQEEIDEVKGTISNERLFQKGETTEEGILMREQNIADLTAYLEFLEEKAA